MKKRNVLIVLGIVVVLAIGGGVMSVVGHDKSPDSEKVQTEKSDKRIDEIKAKAKEMTNQQDEAKKLTDLKNLQKELADYQKGHGEDTKVIKGYETMIAAGKKYFTEKNDQSLTENTATDLNQETADSLNQKSANLKTLTETITAQGTTVYTKNEADALNKKITDLDKTYQEKLTELNAQATKTQQEQAAKAQADKEAEKAAQTATILSTDDSQKYLDAYNQFSMKGNPMPPVQRGSIYQAPEHLASIGLTGEEYNNILWGIVDYYGNAEKQGQITSEQAAQGKAEAQQKMNDGVYALHPIEKTQGVTAENVMDYVNQYVQETTGWDLQYMETRQNEDGSFHVYFISQDPTETAKKGYIGVSADGTVARYSNAGTRLTEPMKITLP